MDSWNGESPLHSVRLQFQMKEKWDLSNLAFIASEIVRKEASEEKLAEVALHGADQGMEFIET